MNLSKEMALRLHRMMWSDMQKELGDNPSGDMRNRFKTEWIQRMFPEEYIANHCFLCEYAKDGCSYCPIDWGNERVSKWHALCAGNNTSYLSSPISEILALPERDTERDYKSCVSTDEVVYENVLNTLARYSGIPAYRTITDHIEAIQKKAVDDYFKNNPGSKLVTMDVDAAFKQYAREQKAPIFKELAEQSGLDVTASVTEHIEAIQKKTADLSERSERGRIKRWLSTYSWLPAAKELHEHVSAIIDDNYEKGRKDLLEEMRKRVEG